MQKTKMVAVHAFRYAGRNLCIGDEFMVDSRDTRVLVILGRAEIAGVAHAETANDIIVRQLEAELVGTKPKLHYRRRDMVAE